MATKYGAGSSGAAGFSGGAKGKERRILILLAAAGSAFFLAIVGLVVANMLKKDAAETAAANTSAQAHTVAPVSSVTIFLSPSRIPLGTPLDQVRFTEAYWPRHTVPDDAILDRAELRGKFAARDIPENVPVIRSQVSAERKQESLPITPGMRAVTIQVDAASSVEGWARPGAKVDVVLTFHQGGELKSKVIAQNARVLSAGGESSTQNVSGASSKAVSFGTITLELTAGDALAVQTSRQLGTLSLLMRSVADDKAASTTEMGSSQISGNGPAKKKTESCNSGGTMRIGGKEYIIDCSGNFQPLVNTEEP